MKKLIIAPSILFAIFMTLAFVLPTSASDGCTDVSTSRGMLTAKVVAASNDMITVDVDATGCDIGVYVPETVSNVTITDVHIHDADQYGVFNDGGIDVDVTDSTISETGNHSGGVYSPNGAQLGLAVFYVGGANGVISDNIVVKYQKNGITANGTGTNVSVTDNDVMGAGRVDYIAQNGVQISRGATGNVSGNQISEHYYTGCSNQDAAKTGCTPWVSTGILLYDVEAKLVKHSKNNFQNNQFNMLLLTAQSLNPGI